jgi:glycosyltransferase involved in cell wall biosynthesis
MESSLIHHVAFIGNHLPRQCGIATFTTHICNAIVKEYPSMNLFTLALNDLAEGYDYPDRVRFQIPEHDLNSYYQAAEFLKLNHVDVVCVQHEYGIFGGNFGRYIVDLLQNLNIPIVTTLHTVQHKPLPEQKQIAQELASLSDRLIVMSERGRTYLEEIYEIDPRKIHIIQHGVPETTFIDTNYHKGKFNVAGKTVILTFGLLSPSKGIEYVIGAMPSIIEQYPDVVYIVLGATHPNVIRHEGKAYLHRLQEQARELGVEKNVIFTDEFVSEDRLIEMLQMADIYITPYLGEEQIVSGTLSYAVGAGKAIVSTPYWHAQEILSDGRGLLVPFRDSTAIANQVCYILGDDVERHAMRKRAFDYARDYTWLESARQYVALFQQVREERHLYPCGTTNDKLPAVFTLKHIRCLTDGIGMMQHAVYSIPDYTEGYTTDDNSRALIATVLTEYLQIPDCEDSHSLATRYLAFVWHAYDKSSGYYNNFMTFDRRWLTERKSEDSHGRALWAFGTVLRYSQDPGFQSVANMLFNDGLPVAKNLKAPRAWAFTLFGIYEYLHRFFGDRTAHQLQKTLAKQLLHLYQEQKSESWKWFEPFLTYDNAALARALLLSGHAMGDNEMVDVALEALAWLMKIQQPEGDHFVPIGSNGFYERNGSRARFDQQPIEAYSSIAACLSAYHITKDNSWEHAARLTLSWFYGQNDLHMPLFSSLTGGCRDGLHLDRVNQNQGAESSLALLLSHLSFFLDD